MRSRLFPAVAVLALLTGASTATAYFQGQTNLQDRTQAPDQESAWVCPMHPDYTTDTPGTCPRCGMTLVRTAPYDVRDYRVVFHTEPAVVKPGQKIKMFFKFLKPDSDDVIKSF